MKNGIKSSNKDLKEEKMVYDTSSGSNYIKGQNKDVNKKPDIKYPWDY